MQKRTARVETDVPGFVRECMPGKTEQELQDATDRLRRVLDVLVEAYLESVGDSSEVICGDKLSEAAIGADSA